MATARGNRARLAGLDAGRLEVALVAVYLVGLLLYSYPALVVRVGGIRVLRPDWLLSLPLLAYVGFRRREIVLGRPAAWAIGFLAVALVSAVAGNLPDPAQFLSVYLQLLYAVGLFVALGSLQPSRAAFRAMLRTWVLLLVVAAAYAVYQAVAFQLNLPFADPYLVEAPNNFADGFGHGGYARPAAVFEEPGWFASALVTGVAVLVPCVASGRAVLFSRRSQWLALGAIVGGVGVAASFSGYLTLAAAGMLFLVLPDTRRFAATMAAVATPVVAIGIAGGIAADAGFVEIVLRRAGRLAAAVTGDLGPGGGSIHVRYARSLAALRVWASAPLLGVGLGQYEAWVAAHPMPDIARLITIDRPLSLIHGVWPEVLASTGLAGLAAFGGTWLAVVRMEARALAGADGVERTLVVAVLALTLVQLIDWTWGFSMLHPYRWGLIGLGLGFVWTVSDDVDGSH